MTKAEMIVQQDKNFIIETKSDEGMSELRKTSYVNGYLAAIDDVDKRVKLVEGLSDDKD